LLIVLNVGKQTFDFGILDIEITLQLTHLPFQLTQLHIEHINCPI